jgi:uncharacterized membrane protein YhaH (DUF805 family)
MIASKVSCELEYIGSDWPSTRTVLSTMAIMALSLLLEVIVNTVPPGPTENAHGSESIEAAAPLALVPTSAPVQEVHAQQPQPESRLQASAEQQPQLQTENTNEYRREGDCCPSHVSPLMRANRLITALLFFVPLVAVFSLRVRDMGTPYIRPECRAYIEPSDVAPENMYTVVLLDFVPFIGGCFAVLRALVDVLLVRCDAGLGYGDGSKREREWIWLPCMPFMAVFGVIYLAWMCLKWPVALLMGRRIWSEGEGLRERGDDIEMQGEQARGLLNGEDENESGGGQEGGAAGLPSYDKVVGPSNKV